MPRKVFTAQPKFKMLVANLEGASDPSRGPGGNPVKARISFEQQYLPEIPGRGFLLGDGTQADKTPGLRTLHWGLLEYPSSSGPIPSTGTIELVDIDFSEPAHIHLGNYSLVSGEDFTASAASIAATIDSLPEFSAVAVGNTVTITGPVGPAGNDLLFAATYEGTIQNFILTPTDGSLAGAEPVFGPVTIGE